MGAATAAAVLLFSSSSIAADAFCESYADEAVAQASAAALHSVCGLAGPLWDTDRDSHLAWCQGAKAPGLATAELAKRHAALITCMVSLSAAPAAPCDEGH